MSALDRKMPGPKELEPTLRKITEVLARELASPGPLAPDWSDVEWTVARAVAAMHGVSPLLARMLRWQGPPVWVRFLIEQREHTHKRHARIEVALQLIDRRMRDAGVAATALKGAQLHAMGIYAAGDRPMADIDLLVLPRDADRAVRAIESLGFRQAYETWKERVFVPLVGLAPAVLGEHADNDIKIELHTRIGEKLPWRITDVSEAIFPRRPHAGLNDYPSMAALMMHLLLHAAGGMAAKGLRLMHLNDIARLSSRMTRDDWAELLASKSRERTLWWAFPLLRLVSRYYPSSIPAGVLAALAAACPMVLGALSKHKTLYDVSFSYLWVDAFPGIEWSRSCGEVLQYAANRIRPGAAQIALREHFSNTQVGANLNSWVRLPQSGRVFRWLVTRPTRVTATSAVYAALAETA